MLFASTTKISNYFKKFSYFNNFLSFSVNNNIFAYT